MFSERGLLGLPLFLIKLLARLGSITSIVFLLLLFQSEMLNPSGISGDEWAGLIFFPIGVIIGMIVAWWKEGLGVSVTLGSLLAFYFVYGYLLKYNVAGWAFVVFASPAFLFLLHWLLHRTEQRHGLGPKLEMSSYARQ